MSLFFIQGLGSPTDAETFFFFFFFFFFFRKSPLCENRRTFSREAPPPHDDDPRSDLDSPSPSPSGALSQLQVPHSERLSACQSFSPHTRRGFQGNARGRGRLEDLEVARELEPVVRDEYARLRGRAWTRILYLNLSQSGGLHTRAARHRSPLPREEDNKYPPQSALDLSRTWSRLTMTILRRTLSLSKCPRACVLVVAADQESPRAGLLPPSLSLQNRPSRFLEFETGAATIGGRLV